MLKHKILIFLAVWKRPEITEICFLGLSRLRKKFGVEAFAVISEDSMIPLCEKYGVAWCIHENQPLGTKKNYGLTKAMQMDFDFMIEIGSDDILKDGIFDLYPFDRDVMALRDFVMINSEDGECRRLKDRDARFGLGRAVSRKALQAMKCSDGMFRLWGERHTHGLDNNSSFRLASKGFLEKRYSSPEPVAIDIKSQVNIWPFQKLGIDYEFNKAMEGLSEEEVEAIKNLIHVSV